MHRAATLVLILTLVPGAAAAQTTSAIPTLRREVAVASDLVRIGDLIDNAGPAAGTAIFRAPDLGDTGTVPTDRVIDAARAHGVVGVDTRGIPAVVVSRAGRVIMAKDLEAGIARALAGRSGLGETADLTITLDREAHPIRVEPSVEADLHPTRVVYDRQTGRFDVSFTVPGGSALRSAALRYTGSVVETRSTAVLTRALARGELVKAADVAIDRRPKAELGDDAFAAIADMVGRAARRPLRAGQALRQGDLMRPELVQRNEPVTLIYEVPGIVLTVRGKALDSGAHGDVVNVLNIQSKRTVQGTVSGPGRVTVAAAMPRLAASLNHPPEPAGAVRRRNE